MIFSNSWVQLVAGITGMVAVARFQYSWTQFVEPLRTRHGWDEAEIKNALFLFFRAGTNVVGPAGRVLAERVGQRKLRIDELGAEAVDDRFHVKNLHATILHLMGLDPDRLTYFYGGLDQKLVGVEGAEPIWKAMA
jgi:hypothetical protein